MPKQQQLLVLRFSSLGDVAMTVPVISHLLAQHPGLHITMVSTEFVRPLFADMERVHFHAADLRGKHKGLNGLRRLYSELSSTYSFDGVADLHNVLRTKILRMFFSFSSKRMAAIDKGRKEKKQLTRRYQKKLRPLKSTFQRYADVFNKLGYPVNIQNQLPVKIKSSPQALLQEKSKGKFLVGIAPFALHKEKMYPADRMKQLIKLLLQNGKIKLYLLGGKNDAAELDNWTAGFNGVTSLAGKLDFENELKYISGLDLVVSMDSANMHLASLYGVTVVSIWGGTHPYLGFYGWGQSMENAVQVDLDCRPSSVFGKKNCHRHLECMLSIPSIVIYERIMQELNKYHT